MNTAPEPTVIFLHIPKSAGSTLNWIIKRQYDPAEMHAFRWYFHQASLPLDEFRQLSEAQKRRIKIITGHISFGLHKVVPGSTLYVTILRDPMSRVISGYYNILRDRNHPLHGEVVSLSLKEYVKSGLAPDVDNGQTRRISGLGMTVPYGQCTAAMLDQAKHNLQHHFAVVGLTERFDETLLLLKKTLGWSPFYLSQNRGRNRPRDEKLPSETLELIKAYNQLDLDLYRYVQQRFNQQIQQQCPSFKRELIWFRWMNQSLFKLYIFPHRVAAKIKWERKKRLRTA